VREQHDQRDLAHVGRFAAHVRAGDDQHAAVVVELEVVGDERLARDAFHHRMAAGRRCCRPRLGDQFAGAFSSRRSARSASVREHVQLGEGLGGAALQRRRVRRQQFVQQLLVEPALARQRAFALSALSSKAFSSGVM
jgi:hypothetical protein